MTKWTTSKINATTRIRWISGPTLKKANPPSQNRIRMIARISSTSYAAGAAESSAVNEAVAD